MKSSSSIAEQCPYQGMHQFLVLGRHEGESQKTMRSSVRFPQGTKLIELLVNGDGKRYKLILRTELAPRVTYAADFIAEPTWQNYRFNLSQFKATFRGQVVNAPTLSFSDVIEFGILISNNQAGSFGIQLKTLQST